MMIKMSPRFSSIECGCTTIFWFIIGCSLLLVSGSNKNNSRAGVRIFVEGKTSSGRGKLSGARTELLLAKFPFSPKAHGKVQLQLFAKDMYVDEQGLRFHMYNHEEWKAALKRPLCQDKVRMATASHSILFQQNTNHPDDPHVKKQKEKQWTATVDTRVEIRSNDRPQYWYFTVDDCTLELYYHDSQIPMLDYTIQLWDDLSNGSGPEQLTHLPADETGMMALHTIQFLVSMILAALLLFLVLHHMTIKSNGQIHISVLMVLAATGLNALSSLFELIHLKVYESNGVGSYTLDAMASHCEAVCDSLLCICLLSVGAGWTLPRDVLPPNNSHSLQSSGWLARLLEGFRNPISSLVHHHPVTWLGVTILAAHAILAQWGRLYDDDFDCYHSLEHPPGRALLWWRACLGILFWVAVASVRSAGASTSNCPRALMDGFYPKLAFIGVAWFWSLPLAYLGAKWFLPPHRKHQVVSVGLAVVQFASLLALAWLFTGNSNASSYHRISKAIHPHSDLSDLTSNNNNITNSNSTTQEQHNNNNRGGPSFSIHKKPLTTWNFGHTKVRLD